MGRLRTGLAFTAGGRHRQATRRRRPLFAGGLTYARPVTNDEMCIANFASFSAALSTFWHISLNEIYIQAAGGWKMQVWRVNSPMLYVCLDG